MADLDRKLSQVTAAATLTGAELVYVVQGGAERRTTAALVAALAAPTNLSYDPATRLLTSSTGADVTLSLADSTNPGLLSAAGFTKLAGIAAGATANATDAQLRDRSTHTGTQAAGTITGLAAVATSGAYGDLSGRPTLGTAAALDAGTSAGNVVRLDPSTGQLPAVDGSQLTGLPSGLTLSNTTPAALGTAAVGTGNTAARADHVHSMPSAADVGAATAAQGALAATAIQPGNAALSDSREWSAATIDQAEAEGGTATTRRAFTALRVFQSVAAWWAANRGAPGAIGGTTPAAGTFSALAATVSALLPNGAPASPLARMIYAVSDTLRYRDSGNNERLLLNATDNLSNLANTATALANLGGLPSTFANNTLSYSATTDLSMSALTGTYQTLSLTGHVTFTTSNRAAGRTVTIRILCDSTSRNFTFPAGWVFVGTKPSSIAASKTAVLSLSFFGTADTDCVAAYGVQA